MADDKITKAIEAVGTKKAKLKKIEAEPSGTKAKKLDRSVLDALTAAFPKANLSRVRVHTGGNAQEICKSLGAKSFAIGDDIFFGKSGDATDKQLLAQELTHVVQQGGGKVPKAQPKKALTSK